jgi:UDP-glucose 4-epimerase
MGQYGMVIPNFVQQALKDEPIRVFGDGEQTRCFTYVGDAVRAIVDLLDAPDAEGEIVNIGSNEEVSINQLAERVRVLSGSASEITHIPYEEVYGPGFEDMQRRTPDISKLQRMTGYAPSYATDDILDAVIHYFRHGQRAQTDSAAALAAQKALTV